MKMVQGKSIRSSLSFFLNFQLPASSFQLLLFSLLLLMPMLVSAQTGTKSSGRAGGQNNSNRAKEKRAQETKQGNARAELAETTKEIDFLLQRLPDNEDEILQAIATIKTELKLRELRWRLFERGEAVNDDPFIYHPIRIELFGTYERLTDMLLSFAAFNYLVVVDDLKVKRARQQAPLVSVEASFTVLLYSLPTEAREQLVKLPNGDAETQLEAAQQSLALLSPRFAQRVACWSALRTLGRRFPKSIEIILTELALNSSEFKFSGISRLANTSSQIAGLLAETKLFTDIVESQEGPNFNLQANLPADKAYQQWLEGNDATDQESLARDPFTSIYSLEQLTQGSGANYPPLDKRLEDYLAEVNRGAEKRPDRISAFLVAELSLAGLYYTPSGQGAIFKTPNQKEIYVGVGARCYNGRFIGIQQGRALFEETLVANGKQQLSQIVKSIDSANCTVVTLPPAGKAADSMAASEAAARQKLPAGTITLNVSNIELQSLLPLLHELSGYQFAYVIDQSVPRLCVSISRERATFADLLVALLHSANLTVVEERGLFRIITGVQAADAQAPALATSLVTPPPAGKFGAPGYRAEPVTLSITDAELGDILSFFTAKYGVKFALSETAKRARVTASITEQGWQQALFAMLRAARLGIMIEGERALIVDRAELLKAQSENRVKIEQ